VENLWNMDETGLNLGSSGYIRGITDSHKKRAAVGAPSLSEWVSIIECVSASGRSTRPAVLFKGKTLRTTWFPRDLPDYRFTTSENGWTTNEIGVSWLNEIFLPETKPDPPGRRVLILDGHASHVSVEFQWTCWNNEVDLVYLPSHTSHVLQPLDLANFSPLKSKYRAQIADLAAFDNAAYVKKERFVKAYAKARQDSLSARNVRSGWKKAGIVPFNPQVPLSSPHMASHHREVSPPPPLPTGTLVRQRVRF